MRSKDHQALSLRVPTSFGKENSENYDFEAFIF